MIVLDTSTLILLAKIDLLRLLAQKTPLRISHQVHEEALVKPGLYDARMIQEMVAVGEIQVSREIDREQCKKLEDDFGLDAGEASALWLAREMRVPLGTDDALAIKASKIIGVGFVTAIHVLIELYTKGRLDPKTALVKLDRLEKIGRYNLQIVEDARQKILEKRGDPNASDERSIKPTGV